MVVYTALNSWVARQNWVPFSFQRATWEAYTAGKSGLVHAPTGLGKTYAVLGGPIIQAFSDNDVLAKPQ